MQSKGFKSPLSYSVQNEDYRTEQRVMEYVAPGHERRILLVASSGENALSLLTDPAIASVDAVDLNPAQVFLCALRAAGVQALTLDDQLALLGCDAAMVGGSGREHRLALFDQLRPALTHAALEFWDSRRDTDLAHGVHHVGRNDRAMQDTTARLRQAGFSPLARPVKESDLGAWTRVYETLFTPDYIRETFGVASEALAARIAGISAVLGECHFRALMAPGAAENYFVTTVFASRYALEAGAEGYPLYLQPAGQDALRALGMTERLHLHVGNILEQMPKLADQGGRYDLISISNIADWMTEDEFRQVVLLAKRCLVPGGALLARTATGKPMIIDVMRAHMRCDDTLNALLSDVERGPWFRVIAAGFAD
ncbi:MAG: DUF3419 family protein [Anaerolineae bacterium]|nr:DUF3419 family protein [Anaerolineae bacterium]